MRWEMSYFDVLKIELDELEAQEYFSIFIYIHLGVWELEYGFLYVRKKLT